MPDKAAFLDLMSGGCAVAPSQVRDETAHDNRAIVYADKHPVVEPPDPDSNARFNLAAGDMPQELDRYRMADAARDGFAYRLVSRRTRHRFNSTGGHLSALKAKRQTNPAHINPADLERLGIPDGALIRIDSAVGHVTAVASAAPEMRVGIVSMAHAFGDIGDDASKVTEIGASTNRLVSETVDYDPITGQSLQSAIPVRIAAVS
jgi:anaerobic selenocysteine-containing dehydrogenase